MKYKYATQIKVDIFYNDIKEVHAFQRSLQRDKNNGFEIEIPDQDMDDSTDMTEFYKSTGEVG